MTFAVAFEDGEVIGKDYIPAAVTLLVSFVLQSKERWENQPLNVVVTNRCRSQVLDPRDTTGELFCMAIVDEHGNSRRCRIDLVHCSDLTPEELYEYVERQLASEEPVNGQLVAAVFNLNPTYPERVHTSYIDFPGAWLRVAPDASTGGLVASADHVVLDGAMFQDLILRLARSSLTGCPSPASEEQLPEEEHEPVARLRVDGFQSLTEVLKHVVHALQDFGIELLNGRDTAVLVTIPHHGPEVNHKLTRQCRRILPLIMDLEGAHEAEEIKKRIQNLNVNGWCSVGAQVWNRLYCGNVFSWLVYYMERIAPAIPFQRTSRYLAGAALISCLPPIKDQDVIDRGVTHLSCRTMNPPHGGPTITIMQICSDTEGAVPSAFITISGSGQWSRISRLNKFRDSLAQRIHASQANGLSKPTPAMPVRSAG